jgi:preprotein translocase subunit SecF
MLNILGKRYLFFGLSLILILPGMLILLFSGIPLAIDFTGGSLLDLKFSDSTAPQPAQVITLLNDLGLTDVQVSSTTDNALIIRTTFLNEEKRSEVLTTLKEKVDPNLVVQRFDSVGPTIGQEVGQRAALAVGLAALGVVLYIFFAFRGVAHSLRYGICAILAELHDVLVIISIIAIGAKFFGWQVDSLFLTALLTIIGFSVQDTIVVFDRIRENSNIYKKLDFETLVNHSIVQTLMRSINTQLMTSEFLLLSLVLIGGVTLKEFSFILLIGLLMGTYSSIFIAAPILVVWENKEWRYWFRGKRETTA